MKKFTLLRHLALQLTLVTVLSGCITINAPEPTDQGVTPTAESQATTEDSSETSGTDYDQDANSEFADQSFDYTISGGCQDSYDEVGYYGMMESLDDDCTLIVQVSPVVPQREVELQFFEDGWIAESTTTTDSEGFAYLDVDPYCEDDLWCDGLWEFRVLVNAKDNLPSDTSVTFEIEFFPN
jgi:hypothetical protein